MKASEHALALAATLLSPRDQESLHHRPTGLSLEVVRGPDEGKRFELADRNTILGGRAAGLDIVLTDDSVSTTHFEIRLTANGVFLRDLESTNGTWVGRSRLLSGTVGLFDGTAFFAGDTKLRLVNIDVKSIARSERSTFGTMAGESPAIREVFALLARLGPTPLTTLISGETGTGKEEVARTLHQLSERKGQFIVLDCGTLPTNLAESAILGHVKGAFTGANSDRKGAFEMADGGTLLLDEIGELPLELQPKLLRVLDRGEIEPVGSTSRRTVDVRVLAATHRSLAKMVVEDQFRLDLFHRLRQVEVCVPPLRERPQDVPVLTRYFLSRLRAQHGPKVSSEISDEAMAKLRARHWEGNVRELSQLVEAAAYLASGDIITSDDLRRVSARSPTHSTDGANTIANLLPLECKDATDGFIIYYLENLEKLYEGNVEQMQVAAGYTRKGLRGLYERLGRAWPPRTGPK